MVMLWSGYPINQGPYYSIIYCSDLKGQIESLNPAWGERPQKPLFIRQMKNHDFFPVLVIFSNIYQF
jgi:hypothetical protein